jgi:two-component system sensor histidine kinase HydH
MDTLLSKVLGQDAAHTPATESRDPLARLLKRLAHEIRNPLGSLAVHFQLLDEDLGRLPGDAVRQFAPRMDVIRGELHRLDAIVGRFLKLAGPAALELEPVPVEKLVNHVCELLRPEASARRVEIAANIQPGLPVLKLDAVRMTQALLNLAINGVQAVTERGRVSISASLAGDNLLLQVQDTGPGIPAQNLGDIFDPYFTTKPDGNGLGLWIAQQIAGAHGGELGVENAAGGGALFTLKLPVNRPP